LFTLKELTDLEWMELWSAKNLFPKNYCSPFTWTVLLISFIYLGVYWLRVNGDRGEATDLSNSVYLTLLLFPLLVDSKIKPSGRHFYFISSTDSP
jgi:hypothetical protein